ncbi:hypothetical protein FVE85_0682 [Porphyridium purpureum]|uniref:Uncharacterized protein n=1 Tax=Porphyridium purpureum TaxID=35688 RepID=A0A5J4Z236_PORPP|nr:hypothetical protein FVE85_0682 [Porphyridium purpureum]|eukprot:POR3559..scf208_2
MKTGRSDRRKRQSAVDSFPDPTPGEQWLGVVHECCGANMYDVRVCEQATSGLELGEARALYVLPKRLRNVVWIRAGSLVFIERYVAAEGGAMGEITHVLMPHQLRHLESSRNWTDPVRLIYSRQSGQAQSQAPEKNAGYEDIDALLLCGKKDDGTPQNKINLREVSSSDDESSAA